MSSFLQFCSGLLQPLHGIPTFCQRSRKNLSVRTLLGLKLAAAIGAASTVKVISHRPPRRRKKDPGLSSAHEYRTLSLRAEYSFTCSNHLI